MKNYHNSLLFYTRQSNRSIWKRICLSPVTMFKSVYLALQMIGYTLWSELAEGETVVQAEWNKRSK